MDMTKFSDEDDDGFLNISGKLFLWAKALATGRRPEPSTTCLVNAQSFGSQAD
jgi:hypothetical protein